MAIMQDLAPKVSHTSKLWPNNTEKMDNKDESANLPRKWKVSEVNFDKIDLWRDKKNIHLPFAIN